MGKDLGLEPGGARCTVDPMMHEGLGRAWTASTDVRDN